MKTFRIFLALIWMISREANAETWHPFAMDWDKSPINLSFLLDSPAGKHGFVGIRDNRFVFEDGSEIRFWGTTLSGSGCFPSQDMAPQVAERLYRFGINLVRFYEMDAEWAQPNLFLSGDASQDILNPEAMDRLDFLLYQLETRGIYVWLDGLSSRKLQEKDGILSWNLLPPGLKGYIYFVPELQRLHQDYLSALWSHRNRYTGRQYRDTPSIVLTELFNDNNLHLDQPRILPFSDLFRDRWSDYLQSQGEEASSPIDWKKPSVLLQKYVSMTMGMAFLDFFNFLRGFSVKIPIGSTHAVTSIMDLPAITSLDFVHAEGVWNPPGIPVELYTDRPMYLTDTVKEGNLFSELAFNRRANKPFLVSKWGEPWPCTTRAEMPLWVAAMAGFQDWQGCISSTYRSFHDPETNSLYAPLESFNDPCVMGLMPSAALLFYRGTVKPAKKTAVMNVVPDAVSDEPITPLSCQTTRLVDTREVVIKIGNKASGKNVFSPTEPLDLLPDLHDIDPQSSYRRDPERGLVFIDTPETQAMIGCVKESHFGDLPYLDVQTDEDFAVISVSSLDKQPIQRAQELWIAIVSQAKNQGFRSEPVSDSSFQVVENGHAPIMIRDTPVRLFIASENSRWNIAVIDGNGNELQTLPYQWEDGRLSFRAGIHGSLFYRLSCLSHSERK